MFLLSMERLVLKEEFRDYGLNVDLYLDVLNEKECDTIYQKLEDAVKPRYKNKRTTVTFGDQGLVYVVKFRQSTSYRTTRPWSDVPGLDKIRKSTEEITNPVGGGYSVCAVLFYPNGKVGIAPHRDKEMVPETTICGLSIGATRTIRFSRRVRGVERMVDIALPQGSVYVMNPPTNDLFTHSIKVEPDVTSPRYSLTFRNYKNE
jgi:alkylated DNA repair dioxygenase AlkB